MTTTVTTLTTSAPATTPASRPRPPLIKTSSVLISLAKCVATVALSPTLVQGMDSAGADKTLRHQRTLRPSDFDQAPSDAPRSQGSGEPATLSSPKVKRLPLQPLRDAPDVPAQRKASDRSPTSQTGAPGAGCGSLGASASAPISRLKRQRTLMPGDFKTLQKDQDVAAAGYPLFRPDMPRSESTPPTAKVNVRSPRVGMHSFYLIVLV